MSLPRWFRPHGKGRHLVHADKDITRSDQQTALVVIDLQQALCDAAPRAAMGLVSTRITELLDWAEAHSWPTVFVQHWTKPGTILDRESAGWQLAEPLRGRRPAFYLEKNVLNSFEDGQLHA